MSVNRGKRSICLDLKRDKDRDYLIRLAEKADCIVENFRPGVMERLGLSREVLQSVNPRLVYCSISGFGSDNDGPGYDVMIQGLSGIPSITGDGSQPFKCGASIADLVSGMNAVQGILAALYRREQDGKGSFVDISMLDGQLSLLAYHASAHLNGGSTPKALGNAHPSIHPFGTFRTSDGHINVAIGNDRLFTTFCKGVGVQWHEDAKFKSNGSRVENRGALQAIMGSLIAERTTAQWSTVMAELGIPHGEVRTVPEALKRAKIVTHEHPNGVDKIRTIASPVSICGVGFAEVAPPPGLGQHQREVGRSWGLDE
jgi:formyl-CoA transferase